MFRTILFDVDGVLLSEERYFDASALTVWELLSSPLYLNQLVTPSFRPDPEEPVIRLLRKTVFDEDRVLDFIKERGINANWDMVYLVFSYQFIRFLEAAQPGYREQVADLLSRPLTAESLAICRTWQVSYSPQWDAFVADFSRGTAEKQALLLDLNRIAEERLGMRCDVFSRHSPLWDLCQEAFQEWYMGEEKFRESTGKPPKQPGKPGFLHDEIPIVPPEKMRAFFARLQEMGIELGIGTGRPTVETIEPLTALGILPYFNHDRIVTASDVLETERRYPERAPLAKPQPFTYLKGWLGKETPDEVVFSLPLPIQEGDRLLVVGDSIADLMAAKTIGCRFCATLTGLSGKAARESFERLGADYIVDDVLQVVDLLEK
ncbi:MAG: phosphatase [Bacillus thermozeamaize]|uniref:Phosphatase n=1 Tax=Bacillus thermozeamaize TaxID=230954 RepID=A0A1Y3PP07_9BACI|nr:MAG: phosphatase [Bacillus thermozeamaize]